jgi:DNA-binding transcriptional LysR family regulator
MTHLYLGREVAQFVVAHPGILPSFDIVTSPELPAATAEGRGHLGLIDLSFMHSGVIVEPFLDTEAVCFLPEGPPLAAKKKITPADLDSVNYVAINRRYALAAMLERVFADHRILKERRAATTAPISRSQIE